MATLIGENGTNVRPRAVEDHVQEADHATIPLHSTVEQTACPWDRVRKLGLAMKVLVQVKMCEKNIGIGMHIEGLKSHLFRCAGFGLQSCNKSSDHRAECPSFSRHLLTVNEIS